MILPRDKFCSPVTYTVKHTGARITQSIYRLCHGPQDQCILVGILARGGPSPVSRPALRPIQPLIKWELGALS